MISVFLLMGILLPPPEFDHVPRVPIQVVQGTPPQVNKICRLLSGYRGTDTILACAIPGEKICGIIWPRGHTREGRLWRHERAHCNGWRH